MPRSPARSRIAGIGSGMAASNCATRQNGQRVGVERLAVQCQDARRPVAAHHAKVAPVGRIAGERQDSCGLRAQAAAFEVRGDAVGKDWGGHAAAILYARGHVEQGSRETRDLEAVCPAHDDGAVGVISGRQMDPSADHDPSQHHVPADPHVVRAGRRRQGAPKDRRGRARPPPASDRPATGRCPGSHEACRCRRIARRTETRARIRIGRQSTRRTAGRRWRPARRRPARQTPRARRSGRRRNATSGQTIRAARRPSPRLVARPRRRHTGQVPDSE